MEEIAVLVVVFVFVVYLVAFLVMLIVDDHRKDIKQIEDIDADFDRLIAEVKARLEQKLRVRIKVTRGWVPKKIRHGRNLPIE